MPTRRKHWQRSKSIAIFFIMENGKRKMTKTFRIHFTVRQSAFGWIISRDGGPNRLAFVGDSSLLEVKESRLRLAAMLDLAVTISEVGDYWIGQKMEWNNEMSWYVYSKHIHRHNTRIHTHTHAHTLINHLHTHVYKAYTHIHTHAYAPTPNVRITMYAHMYIRHTYTYTNICTYIQTHL